MLTTREIVAPQTLVSRGSKGSSAPSMIQFQQLYTHRMNSDEFGHLLDHLAANPANDVMTVIVDVTPDLSHRILADMLPNRVSTEANLSKLRSAMAKDQFVLNGETAKFDERGRAFDAKHRFGACERSGKPITILCVLGLRESVADTIDRGKSKTNADALSRQGIKSAKEIAATLSWQWRYDTECVGTKYAASSGEIVELLEMHPGIVTAVDAVRRRFEKMMPPSIAAMAYYNAARISGAESAATFFEQVETGVNLSAGDPALVLRNRLLGLNAHHHQSRPDCRVVLALVIKAWNAYFRGEKLTLLRWRNVGDGAEMFPKFAGDK